jgi:hypothetical protein
MGHNEVTMTTDADTLAKALRACFIDVNGDNVADALSEIAEVLNRLTNNLGDIGAHPLQGERFDGIASCLSDIAEAIREYGDTHAGQVPEDARQVRQDHVDASGEN